MSWNRSDGSTASYYQLPPNATELQHLISHRNMNAQIGEIFRACYRYGMASHSDQLRDAKKVLFYAQAEIERLEAQTQSEHKEPAYPYLQQVADHMRAQAELMKAQEDDEGWIEWNGGPRPVKWDAPVRVRFRAGHANLYLYSNALDWGWSGGASDIIAYRVLEAA